MATKTALSPSESKLPTDDRHIPQEPSNQDFVPDWRQSAAYSSPPVEEWGFEYKVEKKKGETMASLKVLAPAAYSKNIPTFCGTGPVKGSVNLYLSEPTTIVSIVLSVRGYFLPGHSDGKERLVLFDTSHTMWSKDSAEAARDTLLYNRKLSGTHFWPISINIPETVDLQDAGSRSNAVETTKHILPQTFMRKFLTASIQYEIILQIGRGKLKTDYEIRCTFGYFPLTRPPPFPALRTISYQERAPLLDPTVDVDGWVPAQKLHISGTLFSLHPVTIECQFFLSAPLAYTRGSVIPLYMRMQSSNQQAVDLLAAHKAVRVRLQRSIEYSNQIESPKNRKNYHTGKDVRDIVEALWWPAPPQEQDPEESSWFTANTQAYTSCLNGELHLRGDSIPSSTFPAFNVQYRVYLHPFDTTGFKTAQADQTLVEHPVDIVTSSAQGPRAVRYAPAGYNAEHPLTMELARDLWSDNAPISLGRSFIRR